MAQVSGVGGLAALSVLALAIHAADPALLPGGYVGVDVLFVIAGWLAARTIADADSGEGFSLAGYLGGLARRAAPATAAMLAAVSAAVWALWPAQALPDYGLTLAGSALFLANFVFAGNVSYAGEAARAFPLAHMWAPAVAAQALLALALVWMIMKSLAPGRLRLALAVLTVLSYWAGVWGEIVAPERAWAMPHMRAWELLMGALLVFGDIENIRSRALRAGLALAGLALIAAAALTFGPETRHPALPTMAPVLGAGLVIYAGGGPGNAVSALLDARPFALAGGAALSLYLWIWPALVVGRAVAPGAAGIIGALAVALALAALSRRFLEPPFPAVGMARGAVALSLTALAALCVAGVLGVVA